VIDFTFTVVNTGNVTLYNVTLEDPTATVVGDPIASLAPGATDNTTFTATKVVTQADLDLGYFTNTATVTGNYTDANGDPQTATDTDSETVNATQTATVTLSKDATDLTYALVGDVIDFTFTVVNTGNVTLYNVTLEDPTATVVGDPIASLAPGATDNTTFTATKVVTQADLDLGYFTNTATVTGNYTDANGDPQTATDTDSETVNATQTATVTLSKDATDLTYALVGDVIDFTFTVVNTGNVTLYNVTLEDPTATVVGDPIASLAPGATDNTTFTATKVVTQADLDLGYFTNTATVTGNYTDANGDPQTATDTDSETVNATQTATVTLSKDATDLTYALVGDVIDFTFTVVNTGNVTLYNVTLEDPTATVVGDPIASLAPGATDNTTFTATKVVTQADLDLGYFTNTATVTGNYTDANGDPQTATDTDSETVNATQTATVTLSKDATDLTYALVGDVIDFTFTVENTGNVTLYNVTLDDPTATVVGDPIASLAPGATDNTTFTASYVVTQADLDLGYFTNTATVTGNYTDDKRCTLRRPRTRTAKP
jgi:uncharacterized repeat protein (TIGR01451 family)